MNSAERNMHLMLEEVYARLNDAYSAYYLGMTEAHVRQINLCLEGMSDVIDDYEQDPENPDLVQDEETRHADA